MAEQIFLIRHGELPEAYRGRYVGATDAPLDIAAAANSLNQLKESIAREHPRSGICFCSPLRRAVATAEFLFPQIRTIADSRLSEINFGRWENMTFEEICRKAEPSLIRKWNDEPEKMVFPDGEDYPGFARRVDGFFEWITQSEYMRMNPVVVTHGGVIMRAMENFLDITHCDSMKLLPKRGEMRILIFENGVFANVK